MECTLNFSLNFFLVLLCMCECFPSQSQSFTKQGYLVEDLGWCKEIVKPVKPLLVFLWLKKAGFDDLRISSESFFFIEMAWERHEKKRTKDRRTLLPLQITGRIWDVELDIGVNLFFSEMKVEAKVSWWSMSSLPKNFSSFVSRFHRIRLERLNEELSLRVNDLTRYHAWGFPQHFYY